MATRSLNSQAEYLQKIAQMIAEAKFSADADISFWIGLETTVLSKAHEGQGPNPAASQLPGNAVATGAADMGAGAGLESLGASLVGAGMGAGGGVPSGMPGPGGPTPSPAGVRFTPDMMRNAMRPGGMPQGG